MLPDHMFKLQKGDVGRLRPAHRRRALRSSGIGSLHLQQRSLTGLIRPITAPPIEDMSRVGQSGLSRTGVLHARTHAAHEWSLSLGDSTSCALAKDGRSHPAAKFQEGKVAALGELSRQITDDSDAGLICAAADAVKTRWADQVMPGFRHDGDWEAYRAGGIQALTEITTVPGTAA